MQKLADVVLEYAWFLEFGSGETIDEDTAVKRSEELIYVIMNVFSPVERAALEEAAQRSLASWLREPDEHGYTPRKLLTPEQRRFLEDFQNGHFAGRPDGDSDA